MKKPTQPEALPAEKENIEMPMEQTASDDGLQSDAGTEDGLQSEEPPRPVMNWPKTKEVRELRCDLDNEERLTYADEAARLVSDIDVLEDWKKSMAADFKAKIDAKAMRLREVSRYTMEGYEYRRVTCEWAFECSGIDAETGEPIFHPEKKALLTPSGRVVEVRDIGADERQMALPLEPEKATEPDPEAETKPEPEKTDTQEA